MNTKVGQTTTFQDMFRKELGNKLAQKQRKEAVLRMLERRKGEICGTVPQLEVTICPVGPNGDIWFNVRGLWANPDGDPAHTIKFHEDIRVQIDDKPQGARCLYFYSKEKYENEDAVFEALARDLVDVIPSSSIFEKVK